MTAPAAGAHSDVRSVDPLRSIARAAWVLAGCAVVALLYFSATLLLPLVLSLFLFYALDPVVDAIERRGLPRAVASVAVVLTLVGATSTAAVWLWPQVEAVVARVPEGVDRLRKTLREARTGRGQASTLVKVQEAAKAIDAVAAESRDEPPAPRGTVRVEVSDSWRPSDWLWAGGIGAIGLLGQGVTVLFLTIFLLVEDDSFKRKLLRRMDRLGSKRLTVEVLNDIARRIERFIWVQALTSTGVAIITGAVLWGLGIPQPAVWGIFAGLMNVVPYFGPLIVTGVLTAVGFLQLGTLTDGLTVGAISLAITTIEGTFITPHLLSRAASLNHVAIFIAIAVWSWLWGAVGMLLAVPMLMAVKVVCDHVDDLRGIGDFLGDERAVPPSTKAA